MRKSTPVVIIIIAVFAASIVFWRDFAKQTPPNQDQPKPTEVVRPAAVDPKAAHALDGCNIFVCEDSRDPGGPLGDFVTERGGRLHDVINIETDFILISPRADAEESARAKIAAENLHIPVVDRANLCRFAAAKPGR